MKISTLIMLLTAVQSSLKEDAEVSYKMQEDEIVRILGIQVIDTGEGLEVTIL